MIGISKYFLDSHKNRKFFKAFLSEVIRMIIRKKEVYMMVFFQIPISGCLHHFKIVSNSKVYII